MTTAESLMVDFADDTGLNSEKPPRRYLWTDAFAVCNFIQLSKKNNDESFRQLAIDLVDEVHKTLGKHRKDDPRQGWLSSKTHPTKNGLRIGKKLPERKKDEPYDERLEWERDGQYFHYLTKWMLALVKLGLFCEEKKYITWAADLVGASKAFLHDDKMYWKLSIDLTRPLVPSMGQHDPLDGYVTFQVVNKYSEVELIDSIKKMDYLAKRIQLATMDPLGIGELLVAAYRLDQMNEESAFLNKILDAAKSGIQFINPNTHGLAFRELGLAIGIEASKKMNNLKPYWDMEREIIEYWVNNSNWIEHKDINRVILATSLIPDEYLKF
ncbi:MAG: hypothetical protein GF353_11760 [Candidatus Lokiarchaeota archaeon]|nr:hypothetical protein [Candidatus Lokiarchaeota archaeon]